MTLKLIGTPESSVSDLSIVAPAPSNQSPIVWALTLYGKATRIHVTGANSFVAVQMHGGSSIADSTIDGSSGSATVNVAGDSSITGSSIRTSGTALNVGSGSLNISRSRIDASKGATVSGAGSLSIDDSLVVTHGGAGLTTDLGGLTTLTAVNDTIVGDGSSTGIVAGKGNVSHTHVTLQNTTISGYAESIHANQDGGSVDAKVTGSNYDAATVVASPGQLDSSQGNLNVDPRFVDAANGDFHLLPDSLLIDAGSATGTADADLDGAARSLDGNGDGSALPDIGALERPAVPVKTPDPSPVPTPQPQPSPQPPPSAGSGAPVIKALSYSHRHFRVALSKKARVKITIRRRTGRALGSLTRSLRAGKSTIAFKGRIGRRTLAAGRYVAVAVATDKMGHPSKKRSVSLHW